jgi:hypothetical protein
MPTLSVLAIAISVLLSVLFLAGYLIRRRMSASSGVYAVIRPSRLLDDLSGLEDALVDFFASSKVSSGVLTVLAEHPWPLKFRALRDKIHSDGKKLATAEEVPAAAIRAVLTILLFARLVRMHRAGFAITELGREVYRRMRPESFRARSVTVNKLAVRRGSLAKHHTTPAFVRPYSRRVLSEIRGRSRSLFQQ